MIDRFPELWDKFQQQARKRWSWIGRLLTLAAIAYIVILLYVSGFEIRSIEWHKYWAPTLLSLGYYGISLLIQFFIWTRIISFHRKITWKDAAIYARVILIRRLPGGIWHWVGRTAMYSEDASSNNRMIVLANFLEWGILLLVAIGMAFTGLEIIPLALRLDLPGLFFGFALYLAYTWQPADRNKFSRALESLVWAAVYALSWGLGGLIFYAFAEAAGVQGIGWLKAVWVWSITGGSSMLLFIVPGGSGIRELLLAFIMQPYMPMASAVFVGILVRITFILGDVLWGVVGLLLTLRAFPTMMGAARPEILKK